MFKIYVTIIILAVLGIIEYKKHKHVLSATVIYPVMWILSFAGIIVKGNAYYEITWIMPGVVIIGYGLFILGFNLMYRREYNTSFREKIEFDNETSLFPNTSQLQKKDLCSVKDQSLGLNMIMLVATALFIMIVYYMLKVIDLHNIMESLYRIKRMIDAGEKPFPYIVVVMRYFFRCVIWYFSLVYFSIPKDDNYKDENGKNFKTTVLVRLIIILGMSFIVMLTDVSRNDILMTLLPVLFIFLLAKGTSNVKTIIICVISLTLFIVIFVAFIYFRIGAIDLFRENGVESGEDNFNRYLSCGIPAIDQLYRKGAIKLFTLDGENGKCTFALPLALLDMLLGTSMKPQVLQDIIYIGPAARSNVYTYYHWLGKDFGIIYAILFQFAFGLLYGFLYGRIKNGGYTEILWYAILMYPLNMQFFEDQYLAIGQTWFIIFSFLYFIQFVCRRTKLVTSPF